MPAPPSSRSPPAPPSSRSPPAPPTSTSSPPIPRMASAPAPPDSRLAPASPNIVVEGRADHVLDAGEGVVVRLAEEALALHRRQQPRVPGLQRRQRQLGRFLAARRDQRLRPR